jgi:S-disulfanyl-L-cysteine oxidoreductase SoxD
MRCSKIFAAAIVFFACHAAMAQTPSYTGVGRAPTKEEIAAVDISAGPDGKGLPVGQGTAKEGAPIYAAKCAVCHGANAEGAKIGPRLTGGQAEIDSLKTMQPVRTVGGYWPYATSVWDYINRAMPRGNAGTLSANEVYALTAFILSKSNIIKEGDVMDAKTLPKVQMPNRNGFVPPRYQDVVDERKRGCKQGVCP